MISKLQPKPSRYPRVFFIIIIILGLFWSRGNNNNGKVKSVETKSSRIHDGEMVEGEEEEGGSGNFTLNWVRALVLLAAAGRRPDEPLSLGEPLCRMSQMRDEKDDDVLDCQGGFSPAIDDTTDDVAFLSFSMVKTLILNRPRYYRILIYKDYISETRRHRLDGESISYDYLSKKKIAPPCKQCLSSFACNYKID